MRTTIDIDDDVMLAAKELARASNRTAGALISEFARQSLTGANRARAASKKAMYGIAPFQVARGKPVSTKAVRDLLESEGLDAQ